MDWERKKERKKEQTKKERKKGKKERKKERTNWDTKIFEMEANKAIDIAEEERKEEINK